MAIFIGENMNTHEIHLDWEGPFRLDNLLTLASL